MTFKCNSSGGGKRHQLWNMSFCTKFHGNPFTVQSVVETFTSGGGLTLPSLELCHKQKTKMVKYEATEGEIC